MNSEKQLELWKKGPKDDGVEMQPIPSVLEDNQKALKLAEQLKQLATYEVDKEKEDRRARVDE